MQNVMTIERHVKPAAFFGLPVRGRAKRFPVTVTALTKERPPAMFSESLPALTGRKERSPAVFRAQLPARAEKKELKPFPVRIMDITLKSGREFYVDGKRHELPYGARNRITVRAFKKLVKGYEGSIVLVRKGNSYVRLRDSEAIEIPEAGEELEIKSMPSFRLE